MCLLLWLSSFIQHYGSEIHSYGCMLLRLAHSNCDRVLYMGAMEWICGFHPHFICWSPNPQSDGIWRWGFWKVIRVGLGNEGGAFMMRLISYKKTSSLNKERPCEDIRRRRPPANQEEGPHQTPNLPEPWSWTFQPLELWEINACYLSHPVYGILLKQPKLTETREYTTTDLSILLSMGIGQFPV